jgi:hypothetical protein
MESNHTKETLNLGNIGFHYYQDTLHYSQQDLGVWLPRLSSLSASWLVLLSEPSRAIPERFINGIMESGITPIIHFKLPLPDAPSAQELKPILEAYQRWGIQYVVFFDKPNDSANWSTAGWSHQDLVERFLDRFLPLALEALRIGLTPVFPPLQPGGAYWDTSFFKSAMQSMQRRGHDNLVKSMVLGSYAYTFGHELDWGAGGSDQWPLTRPYSTPEGSQDQRGFSNYAWLQSIIRSLGLAPLPVIQFGAGVKTPDASYSPEIHAEVVLSILSRIEQINTNAGAGGILATNFWLLAAEPGAPFASQAWYPNDSTTLPVVRVMAPKMETKSTTVVQTTDTPIETASNTANDSIHPINHYLLLPTYEWGVADWHLDVTRPYIRKYQPTVGFSIEEAALAKRVTVIGGEESFSVEQMSRLRDQGCVVEQIAGDGTSIATQLLER